MITLRGTKPLRWEKTYHSKKLDDVKEKHQEIHPDFIIDEVIEYEDGKDIWEIFEEKLRA